MAAHCPARTGRGGVQAGHGRGAGEALVKAERVVDVVDVPRRDAKMAGDLGRRKREGVRHLVQSAAGLACGASLWGVKMPRKLQGTHELPPQSPYACDQDSLGTLQSQSMQVAVTPTTG